MPIGRIRKDVFESVPSGIAKFIPIIFKIQHHVHPVATAILARTGPDVFEPKLLVEAHQSGAGNKRNAVGYGAVADPLHIGLEQDLG